MKKGSFLTMVVNNTVNAKLYLMHPGDENLMIYDDFPYKPPMPIWIKPEIGLLMLKLKIIAKKKNWKIKQDYTGNPHYGIKDTQYLMH